MSGFTKGPWRIAGKGTIRAGDGWIGRIHWRNRDANARLIAAAPDMYEALKAAVESGLVPKSSVSDGGACGHSEQVRVADMIRAALSKAEGK